MTSRETSERPLWRRDPLVAAAGIAVFVGVLATLPVPEPADPPGGPLPETNFAVVDVTVFDGEQFLPHRDVWVEEGRIRGVGARLNLPEGLPRVDGRGHTLLPGLIDAHSHSFGSALSDALRFGVTTVLDQFTAPMLARGKRRARETLGRGGEADLFSAGNLATAPGGHGTQFGVPVATLTSAAEAPNFVAAREEEGSDWIKIVWEDGSIIGRTGRRSRRSSRKHGLAALEMGVDGLVHAWSDEVISEEDARQFAEARVFVVPTLSVQVAAAGDSMGPALLEETRPDDVSRCSARR